MKTIINVRNHKGETMNYAVVVFSPKGKIIGIESYDFTNNAGRDQRVRTAMDTLATRLNIPAPEQTPRSRALVDALGNEWGRCDATGMEVGMVEVSFGKYGFSNE